MFASCAITLSGLVHLYSTQTKRLNYLKTPYSQRWATSENQDQFIQKCDLQGQITKKRNFAD